ILKKLAYFKRRAERPRLFPESISDAQRVAYQQTVEIRLKPAVTLLAEQLGVTPRRVKVANQTSRWGSCSAKGEISFRWRMAVLPDAVFNYIVAHELAHLRAMDHSPRFWRIVESVCPDHKTHRRWLRQHL